MMTANQANFIINLEDYVEVLFGNNSVWLESVDKGSNTAKVRVLENRETIDVSLNDLSLTGRELK